MPVLEVQHTGLRQEGLRERTAVLFGERPLYFL